MSARNIAVASRQSSKKTQMKRRPPVLYMGKSALFATVNPFFDISSASLFLRCSARLFVWFSFLFVWWRMRAVWPRGSSLSFLKRWESIELCVSGPAPCPFITLHWWQINQSAETRGAKQIKQSNQPNRSKTSLKPSSWVELEPRAFVRAFYFYLYYIIELRKLF